jgi:RNA recognition motif-containing protein
MNLYVGNLSFSVNDDTLRQMFEEFGQVNSASVIKDKYSGDSRGFGFVEMPSKEEAEKAMTELDGKDVEGRALTVNEAKPRKDRGSRGGGRGGGGGGGRRW